jgi:hypothetical protein
MAQDIEQESIRQVIAIATGVISEQIGVIEGCRQLADLRHRVSPDNTDPDFMTVVAVDSSTDHLPLGEERRQWAPSALVEKDKEISEAAAFYREGVVAACRNLIERLDSLA